MENESTSSIDELPDSPENPARLVGQLIDRYEVVRVLGAGAFGVVYEVRHQKLGKRFAMKVIHAELASIEKFVARFEQEARACSFLEHPNCISVTDFGRHQGENLYLVMEYVEGEPLGEIVDRGPMELGETLEITRQILLGLEHAHKVGIIHRDMKLDNVMLVRDGDQRVVKILDFGIARIPVDGDSKITQAGVIFGTPRYMAPEQAMTTQVDERADLYAVGVMLWMMLFGGESPIDGDGHVELLQKKLTQPAPSLALKAPGEYSIRFCELMDKVLQREPSKRFSNAAEMRQEIEGVMGELMVHLSGEQSLPSFPIARVASGLRELSLEREMAGETRELSQGVSGVGRARAGVSAVTHTMRQGLGWAREQAHAWYRCEELGEAPSWKGRARGLFRTSAGRRFGGLSLAALGLLALLLVVVFSGEPTSELMTLPATGDPKVVGAAKTERPSKPEGISPQTEKRLVKVRLFLAKKACREAAVDLRNLVGEQPKLAGAHYLLGAAEVCRRRHLEGLVAYEKAIALDPRYRKDARIQEDVRHMLRKRKLRNQAFTFVEKVLGEAGGAPVLLPIANKEKHRKLRHRARDALKKWGAGRKVDWVASLSLDLRQLGTCKARREAVRKLQLLGDPKAIPALQRARGARSGFLNLQSRNKCIRDEIDEAIAYLEKKK